MDYVYASSCFVYMCSCCYQQRCDHLPAVLPSAPVIGQERNGLARARVCCGSALTDGPHQVGCGWERAGVVRGRGCGRDLASSSSPRFVVVPLFSASLIDTFKPKKMACYWPSCPSSVRRAAIAMKGKGCERSSLACLVRRIGRQRCHLIRSFAKWLKHVSHTL